MSKHHNEGKICQFHKLAWAGLAMPIIGDEGQCSECSHCSLMVRFVKLQKLAQVECAMPMSVKDSTQNHNFSIMRAKFDSFTNWHGQDMMLVSKVKIHLKHCTNCTH